MLKTLTLAAVAAIATVAIDTAPANAGANASWQNGTSLNGIWENGTQFQGVSYNGMPINGSSLQGLNYNGNWANGTGLTGLDAALNGHVIGIELPAATAAAPH